MHEQPNCAYDPMLPVIASDDGYALHFQLMLFYEADVPFECRQPEKFEASISNLILPRSWMREPTRADQNRQPLVFQAP